MLLAHCFDFLPHNLTFPKSIEVKKYAVLFETTLSKYIHNNFNKIHKNKAGDALDHRKLSQIQHHCHG